MSKTVVLPVSGKSVTVREVTSFKQKERESIYRGFVEGESPIVGGWRVVKNTLALLIEDWEVGLPIPQLDKDPNFDNSLGELEAGDFDFLSELANEALTALYPKLSKTLETDADPKATTPNLDA